MKPFRQYLAVLAALLLILAPASFASTASNTAQIPTSLTLGESVSINLSTPSIILTTQAPTANITVTAGWQLQANNHTSGTVYTWFSVIPTGMQPGNFQTQYNGGAFVPCTSPGFSGAGVGVAGKNCGTFAFANNFATDTNDTASVTLTVQFIDSARNLAVGTYSGGILNVAFEVI